MQMRLNNINNIRIVVQENSTHFLWCDAHPADVPLHPRIDRFSLP